MREDPETIIRERTRQTATRTCVGNAARWAEYVQDLVVPPQQSSLAAFREAINFAFSVYHNSNTVGGIGVTDAVMQLENQCAQDSTLNDATVFAVRVGRAAAEAACAFLKSEDAAVRRATIHAAECALKAAEVGLTEPACRKLRSMILGNIGTNCLGYSEVEIPNLIADFLSTQWA